MAAVKAISRQYLRPGNHTRLRNKCSMEGCKNSPINRVYFNVGVVPAMTLLLCPTHVLPYLNAPNDHAHINCINHRYRPERDYVDAYRAQ